MKKIVSIIIIISMMTLLATGCSKNTFENTSDGSKNQVETSGNEKKDDAKKDEPVLEEEKKVEIDKSLTGMELLNSIKYDAPETIITETESINADDSVVKTKTYSKNDSYRMETMDENTNTKMIMIYNNADKATYQYTEGEKTGVVMLDGEYEEDDEKDSGDPSMDDASFKDLFTSENEEVIAKIDNLDGEDVVYLEIKNDDPDSGMYTVKMWISIKYSIPLKTETYSAGNKVNGSKVTSFEANVDIDNKLFEKPSDIEFQEYSLDTLFEN